MKHETIGPTVAPTVVFRQAAVWAVAQGRHAIARAPRPVRDGTTIGAREFGRIIRWGEGPGKARELLRDLRGMMHARPERFRAYVEGVRRQGVTATMAATWAEAYRVAAARPEGVGGATAPERARLMRFIAEHLARMAPRARRSWDGEAPAELGLLAARQQPRHPHFASSPTVAKKWGARGRFCPVATMR
jgi:hypothetical protein